MQHSCPHCGADKHEDGFEVLDENVIHECRCDECAQVYYLLTAECAHCMSDLVFAWPSQPAAQAMSQLDCECCGHKISQQKELASASA